LVALIFLPFPKHHFVLELTVNSYAIDKDYVIKWLLEHGADPNLRGTRDALPLRSAASYGSLAVVKLLLEHGAQPDHNALNSAVRRRRKTGQTRYPDGLAIVKLLVDYGADVNASEDPPTTRRPTSNARVYPLQHVQNTPLHDAMEIEDEEMVRLLLERGADPEIENSEGLKVSEYAEWKEMLGAQQGL
jgi:ankyrin repeat protein